ncbi:glycoside hydrolase family 3 N-terminal domain-containing protein [Demequina sp.]|uniref:glycoside hydrolase family 3 N-terminal domain-containing protein n=1 Tax=Demequina sp. TaxID=2050685 RepID=UPI003A8C0508
MSPARRSVAVLGAIAAITALIVVWQVSSYPTTASAPDTAPTASGAADDSQREVVAPELVPDKPWGPTAQEWAQARADAEALPLEQAAGLVIIPRWSTTNTNEAIALMKRGQFGGIILMGGAIGSASDVREMTAAIQEASPFPWGAIISTDQEGGNTARLRGVVPDLPGLMAAGAAQDKVAVKSIYTQAGVDMRALGFTMNYAPVADMTIGAADPIIQVRSPGDEVDNVSVTAVAALEGYVASGVVPVVKHFPGHGSLTVDSHVGLPQQDASRAQLEERDLVPFRRAVEAGAPAMMMAHVVIDEWGSRPATIEPAAYEYVRNELGFDGLMVTDALDMAAVSADYSPGDAAVAALRAGADILLMPADPVAARDAVVAAVTNGVVERSRLDEAATRVIALQRWQAGLGPYADTGTNYGRELAVAGATVAAQDCAAPLVTEPVLVTGGIAADRRAVVEALAVHGVDASATAGAAPSPTPAPGSEEADAGTVVALVVPGTEPPQADVLVALDGPWTLEGHDASAYVGLYGDTDDALAGLADVLAGAAAPGGTWPVAVDLPYAVCGGA